MKNLIKPFAVILSSAILFAQVKTTVKASKIVYVGLQVEDVEQKIISKEPIEEKETQNIDSTNSTTTNEKEIEVPSNDKKKDVKDDDHPDN